eukprot:gene1484-873_t
MASVVVDFGLKKLKQKIKTPSSPTTFSDLQTAGGIEVNFTHKGRPWGGERPTPRPHLTHGKNPRNGSGTLALGWQDSRFQVNRQEVHAQVEIFRDSGVPFLDRNNNAMSILSIFNIGSSIKIKTKREEFIILNCYLCILERQQIANTQGPPPNQMITEPKGDKLFIISSVFLYFSSSISHFICFNRKEGKQQGSNVGADGVVFDINIYCPGSTPEWAAITAQPKERTPLHS